MATPSPASQASLDLDTDQTLRRRDFLKCVHQPHGHVDPCFMTGKGCVYTDQIDHVLKARLSANVSSGFMIMPFRQNLKTFYANTLAPFFRVNFGRSYDDEEILAKADEVRRPGVIICEGICKRIQESDFIVADISVPNANVFYELGLAYGVNQKIFLLQQKDRQKTKYADHLSHCLEDASLIFYYENLTPLDPNILRLTENDAWRTSSSSTAAQISPKIVLIELHLPPDVLTEMHPPSQTEDNISRMPLQKDASEDAGELGDIKLPFRSHVSSAVGLAIDKLCRTFVSDPRTHSVIRSHQKELEKLKTVKEMVADQGEVSQLHFDTIKQAIDDAYCTIVRTGFANCHPMAYFWLGYGHARGKNVIPITVTRDAKDPIDDLAFDIRAQQHMTFIESRPDLLERELGESLKQMIAVDFMKWSRKRFWDHVVGRRGEVHILTGALHNRTFDREMIGDWDLRTASELASYLASQHYRATIDSPVYPPERVFYKTEFKSAEDRRTKVQEYVGRLAKLLAGRNCIIIASPDVNPLAELIFGRAYDVVQPCGVGANDFDWSVLFDTPISVGDYNSAILAFKSKSRKTDGDAVGGTSPNKFGCAFYEEIGESGAGRGFRSNAIKGESISQPFLSQTDEPETFSIYAHILVAPNPFSRGHHVIVLNGVSGPATFALSQALTGGVTEEFVEYGPFDPQRESEEFLGRFLGVLQNSSAGTADAILSVEVGPANNRVPTSDWRRIKGWRSLPYGFGKQGIRGL